jgi:hypothetical protein
VEAPFDPPGYRNWSSSFVRPRCWIGRVWQQWLWGASWVIE